MATSRPAHQITQQWPPGAACAYCRAILTRWPERTLVTQCKACKRQLVRMSSPIAKDRLRIFCLMDLAKFGISLAIGVTIFATVRDLLIIRAMAAWIGAALIALGMIDIADGYTGLKSGIDRSWRTVRCSPASRRYSIGKYVYGSLSLLIGLFGLMFVLGLPG